MPPGSPALVAVGAGPDAGYEVMLTLSSINKEYLGFAGYCEAYPFLGPSVNIGATGRRILAGSCHRQCLQGFIISAHYANSGLYSGGGMVIHNMVTPGRNEFLDHG